MYTSSTRMELEATKQDLLLLKETSPKCDSIIIATDSMAVLTRIRNNWPHDSYIFKIMMKVMMMMMMMIMMIVVAVRVQKVTRGIKKEIHIV